MPWLSPTLSPERSRFGSTTRNSGLPTRSPKSPSPEAAAAHNADSESCSPLGSASSRSLVPSRLRPCRASCCGGAPTNTVSCTATGGAYDGSKFTKSEECHALEFLNRARYSEMGKLPDTARHVAYDCQPTGAATSPQAITCGYRSSKWTSLKAYANVAGIGSTALTALKSTAAPWKANGLAHDTVASVYQNRTTLKDQPVSLDAVCVTKRLPDETGTRRTQRGGPCGPRRLGTARLARMLSGLGARRRRVRRPRLQRVGLPPDLARRQPPGQVHCRDSGEPLRRHLRLSRATTRRSCRLVPRLVRVRDADFKLPLGEG